MEPEACADMRWYAYPNYAPATWWRAISARVTWDAEALRTAALMASRIPAGRPVHLARSYPVLEVRRRRIFEGEVNERSKALTILYVLALDWQAGGDLWEDDRLRLTSLTRPAEVDAEFAPLDRAARLVVDRVTPGELWREIAVVLARQEAGKRLFYDCVAMRAHQRESRPWPDLDGYPGSFEIPIAGAVQTLDAMLCASAGGYAPGSHVRLGGGRHGVVVSARWEAEGPPCGYRVFIGRGTKDLEVAAASVKGLATTSVLDPACVAAPAALRSALAA